MVIVSARPYRLALDVKGIGFKTADRIARTLGVARDSPQRMKPASLQVIHDGTEAGHVWTSRAELGARAAEMLGVERDAQDISRALSGAVDALVRSGLRRAETGRRSPSSTPLRCTTPRSVSRDRLARLAGARKRGRSGGVEHAIAAFEAALARAARPRAAEAVERGCDAPGARRHGRPRRRQDHDRARHPRRRSTRAQARRAPRRSDRPRRQADERSDRRARRPPCTACSSSTRRRPRSSARPRSPLEAGAVVVDEASMLDLPDWPTRSSRPSPPARASCSSATSTSSRASAPAPSSATSSRPGVVPACASADLPPGRAQPHRHQRPPHQRRRAAARAAPPAPTADFFIVERATPSARRDAHPRARRLADPEPLRARPRARRPGAHPDEPGPARVPSPSTTRCRRR